MSKQHGVDLLETEMQEICNIVNEMNEQQPAESVCDCDNVHCEIETKTNYCWYCLKTIKEQTDL